MLLLLRPIHPLPMTESAKVPLLYYFPLILGLKNPFLYYFAPLLPPISGVCLQLALVPPHSLRSGAPNYDKANMEGDLFQLFNITAIR